jgi:hypothetical protein
VFVVASDACLATGAVVSTGGNWSVIICLIMVVEVVAALADSFHPVALATLFICEIRSLSWVEATGLLGATSSNATMPRVGHGRGRWSVDGPTSML